MSSTRRSMLLGAAGWASAQSPRLVMILASGHGWHLGALGTAELHTPRLDQLAEEGTVYTRAFAASALPNLQPDASLVAAQPQETYATAVEIFRKQPATTVITVDRGLAFASARRAINPAGVQLPPSLPDLPVVREEWTRYLTYLQCVDALAGAVLDAVDRAGLAEEATVLYTSALGPNARRALSNAALHVPLIVRGPGIAPQTRRHDLVSLADLPKPAPREWVGYQNAEGVTVFDGRFRYIHNSQAGQTRPLPAGWQEAQARFPLHWRWLTTPTPAEELYDHAADPDELHNLAADNAYRQHLARLAKLA